MQLNRFMHARLLQDKPAAPNARLDACMHAGLMRTVQADVVELFVFFYSYSITARARNQKFTATTDPHHCTGQQLATAVLLLLLVAIKSNPTKSAQGTAQHSRTQHSTLPRTPSAQLYSTLNHRQLLTGWSQSQESTQLSN